MGSRNNMDLKFIFRALRYRNYRLFFGGQRISLIGTWMQQMALSWLVYRMTESAFLLGLVAFVGQISAFFLAPLAGVIVDRRSPYRLLFVTQFAAMLQAATLAGLYLSGHLEFWHIILLSLMSGTINAFDIPCRQVFVIELIDDKKDLNNAIALNASMVNMARMVGPSVAGLLIVLAGEGMCFLLNAISYLAVIGSLLAIRIAAKTIDPNKPPMWTQLKEGFTYAYQFMPIRTLLMLVWLVSLVGGGFQTMMPVFARDIFHGGPRTLGLLMGATGLGALSGAIFLANRQNARGLGKIIALMAGLFGVGVMLFAVSKLKSVSLALAFLTGFGLMVQLAASNTVLQIIAEEDKRGRVMSFYTMAFMGAAPIGGLLAGMSAAHLGVHKTLFLGGLCCIAGALVFIKNLPILREKIRPIYIKKGIIPEVAEGIQSATIIEDFPGG